MQELLQLPLQVQATLVAGYLGYIILKRDHRNIEKTTDVWMWILVLGLPTATVVQLFDSSWAYISVFFGPLLAIILILLDRVWVILLHKFDISHRINEGDVWKTLSCHKGTVATQIKLVHKNGNSYLCHSTFDFENDVFAPFIMDDDGIAFYVTDTKGPEDKEWIEVSDVSDNSQGYGSMITYFPRDDIKFLEMRYVHK